MSPAAHAELLKLTVAEKIQLVEDLWDSIVADPDSLSLTDAQRQELDRRLRVLEESPTGGATWSAVRDRITASE